MASAEQELQRQNCTTFAPQGALHEVLPKAGLVVSEKGNLTEVLCKPKIMPLKSITLIKLEEMEAKLVELNKQQQQQSGAFPNQQQQQEQDTMAMYAAQARREDQQQQLNASASSSSMFGSGAFHSTSTLSRQAGSSGALGF